MPHITDDSKALWLYLFHAGGTWTARGVADAMDLDIDHVFNRLNSMARRGLLVKLPGTAANRRQRYTVMGTCQVPSGLCVAEVQAEPGDDAEPARITRRPVAQQGLPC